MTTAEREVTTRHPDARIVPSTLRGVAPFRVLVGPADAPRAVGWGSSEVAAWEDAAIVIRYATSRGLTR